MADSEPKRVVGEGRFLRLVERDGWEYVERRTASAVVIIVPVTSADELVLLDQYRPPVRGRVLEFPAGTSPLGRVILALQLAGVAVLLFGAGFWYLSEGQTPGRLDDFRWGHFLLLALNYSLFFAIFAVLGYRGSSAFALTVAAVVSLPLLMLHVVRITNASFAFGRVLPLAMLTSTTVVGGVFLDRQRPLVLLAAAVLLIVFLTVSYGSWLAGR